MNIVVTGASGLLGTHFLQQLAPMQVAITATYRNTPPTFLHKNILWQQIDLLDVDATYKLISQADQVYHCANQVSFEGDGEELLHNNLSTTANIVNACLEFKIAKLLFVSSVAAIARLNQAKLITEDTPWVYNENISKYGLSKYKAEMEVWRGVTEGLSAIIINPSIILTEGNWQKSSAQIFKSAYKEFPFYTMGVNGFVDVVDVVSAGIQLMQSTITNQRFIINQGNYSYKEILTLIANAFNKKPPKHEVKKWMSNLIWPFFAIKKMLFNTPALITKETAQTAHSIYKFNNQKLLNALPNFLYTPLQISINRICKHYLNKENDNTRITK